MAVARLALDRRSEGAVGLSDEIELYQRTYNTLLRSSGETHLRVLDPSHRASGSSLHPLAASDDIDLGAFIYAIRRLPDGVGGAQLVAMAQQVEALVSAGLPVETWDEAEAPPRRRRWYDDGAGTLAVLLASPSDLDDLLPTLVAFQIEWNKIRIRQRAAGWQEIVGDREPTPEECATLLGGSADDWGRLHEAWGERFAEHLRLIARDLIAFVETMDPDDILRQELAAFREGRAEGSWENFLYFVARIYFATKGSAVKAERRAAERAAGVTHLRSTTALRWPAQILPLAALRC